jgi:glycosyltransferase involved in cell wall biosynthesis
MLTIIFPNFNEKNINRMVCECQDLFPRARLIVANDPEGRGKGYATLQGIKHDLRFIPWLAEDIVVFIDGDGDIEPRMINRLLPFLEDYGIVVGTKPVANLPLKRRIITILSRLYIKIMFGLDMDTQTGIKAFRTSAIPWWESEKFLFDVELLYNAKKMGIKIIEVPIEITAISKDKGLKVLWTTLVDSLDIWFRVSFRKGKTKT